MIGWLEEQLECPSTWSFPSVALGVPDPVVHCQLLRGHQGNHRAIYMGKYPHEWEEVGEKGNS